MQSVLEGTKVGSFFIGKRLVAGAFATIYQGKNANTLQIVAIKAVRRVGSGQPPELVASEVLACKTLRHANIVPVLEVVENQSAELIFIAMEYEREGDLLSYVNGLQGPVPEEQARKIFKQVVEVISFLHREGWVHRDLKPENLLRSGERILLCDFGSSAQFTRGSKMLKDYPGTVQYCAPEVLAHQPYEGPEVDVWGLGVILYVMLAITLPYEGDNADAVRRRILAGPPAYPSKYPSLAKELTGSCLAPDPAERATLEAVLLHPWFTKSGSGKDGKDKRRSGSLWKSLLSPFTGDRNPAPPVPDYVPIAAPSPPPPGASSGGRNASSPHRTATPERRSASPTPSSSIAPSSSPPSSLSSVLAPPALRPGSGSPSRGPHRTPSPAPLSSSDGTLPPPGRVSSSPPPPHGALGKSF